MLRNKREAWIILFTLLLPASVFAGPTEVMDLTRYPTWFRLVEGAGAAAGTPDTDGWQGIRLEEIPEDIRERNFFNRWWSDLYGKAYPHGFIDDGVRLQAWSQIQSFEPSFRPQLVCGT